MTKPLKTLKDLPQVNLPQEFFYSIQSKMGGNLSFEHLAEKDKESFILAIKVVLGLTSYNIQEE